MKSRKILCLFTALLLAGVLCGGFAEDAPASRPIGVYDSGMGGLIVLESLIGEFPGEDFIFIADNANVPYGTKTSGQIEGYNLILSAYLTEEERVKAICIACNTASANSSELDRVIGVPLVKAIGPTARAAAETVGTDKNDILILATELTTRMGVYETELDRYFSSVPHTYYPAAAQNFVTMVEEGRYGTEESLEEVRSTLEDYLDLPIDKIILGCTHFPKLSGELKQLFPDAELYGAGVAMAEALRAELAARDLLSNRERGTVTLITTGDLESFIEQTSWFKYANDAVYRQIEPDYSEYNDDTLDPAA